MQYILFVHNNNKSPTSADQWSEFFTAAQKSGVFTGGSAINAGIAWGADLEQMVSDAIAGYMLFETDDITKIHRLLKLHPVVIQGGTVELCEAPRT